MQSYQLKIALDRIKPPIWRRLLVPADIALDDLHGVFQAAMGWFDGHLHEFVVGKRAYGPADPDLPTDFDDETGVSLASLISQEGETFRYIYDFGDDWMHTITLEKASADTSGSIPRCIDGKRACPPEDCGGIPGYQQILEALKRPAHPDSEELLDWLGDGFDPEYFDLDGINEQLKPFAARSKRKASSRKSTTGKKSPTPDIDEDKIDDAALALLSLTFHGDKYGTRAWKNFDWDTLNRLHAKGYITDPIGKAKSVAMTENGRKESLKLFARLFSK